jgi:hypothetical protein
MENVISTILNNRTYLLIIALWDLVWKGLALWRAAKNDSKPWFVILLIANTVGILPIAYLIWDKRKHRIR